MSSDRKRKRILRPPSSSLTHYLSLKSLFFCFCFFVFFLYLSSDQFPIVSTVFRPVITVSNLSFLSSFASNSVQDFQTKTLSSPLKIEDRVLFPDHLLLLVTGDRRNRHLYSDEGKGLDCVFLPNKTSDEKDKVITKPALSIDVYDEFRSIVRCPLPPLNYSSAVNLQRKGRLEMDKFDDKTAHSWERVAYGAELDGDTVVVFVKGLNLRPDKESDPTYFSCHFGFGNWDSDDGNFVLTTKAITAAQEVVRCSLPHSIRKNPNKAQGIRVTIGVNPQLYYRRASSVHVFLPSVAKIFNSKMKNNGGGKKYELCACTMVWNHASSLREWIKYHAWLGIQRWFIYDNNSDDGIKEVIQGLEEENYNVSRHTWPWIKTQEAGFSHCTLRAKDECNWVAFMDVDEFFYFPAPTHHHRNMGFPGQNSLRSLVTRYSNSTTIAEIRTVCHSFGPSGLSSPPSQGVTVGYTCRLQSPERHKSIIRPDVLDTTLLNVVHHFRLKKGFRYSNVPQSTAVINHYKYQVWEAFSAKFFRRVATYVVDWKENQNEGSKDRAPGLGTEAVEPPNWPQQFCEVWDTGLRDFVLANLADPATGSLPW